MVRNGHTHFQTPPYHGQLCHDERVSKLKDRNNRANRGAYALPIDQISDTGKGTCTHICTCNVSELSADASQLGLPLLVLSRLLVFGRRDAHHHAHHERLHLGKRKVKG